MNNKYFEYLKDTKEKLKTHAREIGLFYVKTLTDILQEKIKEELAKRLIDENVFNQNAIFSSGNKGQGALSSLFDGFMSGISEVEKAQREKEKRIEIVKRMSYEMYFKHKKIKTILH